MPHRYHEDHIAAKGINSLSHYNLLHKFIPMPQALKIPAWELTNVRNKKDVKDEARSKGGKVHVRVIDRSLSSQEFGGQSLNIKSTEVESYSEVTL